MHTRAPSFLLVRAALLVDSDIAFVSLFVPYSWGNRPVALTRREDDYRGGGLAPKVSRELIDGDHSRRQTRSAFSPLDFNKRVFFQSKDGEGKREALLRW